MARTYRLFSRRLALAAILAAAGCEKAPSKLDGVVAEHTPKAGASAVAVGDIESKDILARTDVAKKVYAKHVLIGWKDLEASYRGQMDPRAKQRSQADASKLALEVLGKLKADPKAIDKLVADLGEDPGMKSGDPYEIEASTQFVPQFKNLALRLAEGEAGIATTNYGYHVIERVPPPPRDPLESADILARTTPSTEEVHVQHVMIRVGPRTKDEADKLVKEVFDKAKAGEDMAALMKQFSDDRGSKDNGQIYDVAPDSPLPEPFKDLSLRLDVNEVGVVKSPAGWHVIKRVQPAPDPLESADILARAPVTDKAKVKHILLGWTEVHADDPRGKARSRADLEKLVKATVDKLVGGAKIDALMAELSEDQGSAKAGTSYDVSPTAQLVPPFKKLSLRLNPGEVGVVRTMFGIHIIQRVDGTPAEKPAPATP